MVKLWEEQLSGYLQDFTTIKDRTKYIAKN